ncbi:ABC transporter substrate-binding protein [Derxia gummosa]|uniref:ABC transporter substrate-binding protein n=1 Tax=Derxia gummosa DSM 723 TaxID=1121388 RepID=A0A8B6X4C9_9BURK|nr:ABC transporter substrate-binding protein [Derxia gummosa]
MKASIKKAALLVAAALAGATAHAEVRIGVTLSATGPAAALGIPQRNMAALLPASIGGEKVELTVFDDATDPSAANRNARRLATENKVDVIIGSSNVPGCAAIAEVAAELKLAQVAMCPVEVPPASAPWVFRAPQSNGLMASALVAHMKQNGVKTLGFIGYADAYGEGWLRDLRRLLEGTGISLVAVERYARTDTAVTAQALKLASAAPDAILIVGSGAPAALPHTTLVERGYKGRLYQTHAAANADFLRVGGKAIEGAILPVGPVVVASQLPAEHPLRKPGIDLAKRYEEKYGQGSFNPFAAYLNDAFLLVQQAVPVALKTAKPGTPEFRVALRDALEGLRNVEATNGVFSMSAADHSGLDERARVLVKVEAGAFRLLPGSY